MKEHIEQLELLVKCTPIETRAALRAAIELMNAAKPLDEAAEREYCRLAAQRARDADESLTLVDWLMRERARVRAEGYMRGQLVGMDMGAEDTQHRMQAKLAAAHAEIERLKEQLEVVSAANGTQSGHASALETKLSAAQALNDQCAQDFTAKLSAAQAEIERLRIGCQSESQLQEENSELLTKHTNLRAAAERYLRAYHEDEYPEDRAASTSDDAMDVLIDQLSEAAEASR